MIIAVLLLAAELIYFRIADKCKIIYKPNERSSHSTIVLRGGGVIFAISMVIWYIWFMVNGSGGMVLAGGDCAGGFVLLCGCHEYHQLYGWNQWNYGGVCAGNAGADCLG